MKLYLKKVIHCIIFISALYFSACSKQAPVDEKPRPVYTHVVAQPEAKVERGFSGQLVASDNVALAFEVGGRIVSIEAIQGQSYAADALLAHIDATDYETRRDDARSKLNQSSQELLRIQRLFESGNASQSQLDTALAQEKSARATYELAQKQVDHCTLTMPYAGTIASVDVDAQQVVSSGQAVLTIEGDGPMEFLFGVPTDVVTQIEQGDTLTVSLSDIDEGPLKALVTEVSPTIEQNTTYLVTAKILQKFAALRSGMAGEAFLTLDNPDGQFLRVPLTCVVGSIGDLQSVWVLGSVDEKGYAKVSKREVTTGELLQDGKIAILKGLNAGEEIVSRGVSHMQEGMEVIKKH